MLPVKNGIRSVLRSPGKTVLFFLLLLSLTAGLALGLCVYSAVSDYLEDCDTYYQTIAELEYIGHSYPDSKVCDEALTQVLQSGELDAGRWQSYQKLRAENAYAESSEHYLAAKEQKFKEISKINKHRSRKF